MGILTTGAESSQQFLNAAAQNLFPSYRDLRTKALNASKVKTSSIPGILDYHQLMIKSGNQ